VSEQRKGFVLGIAAWAIWGFFPLYWPLLRPSGSVEILAHRVIWSMVVMGVVLVALGRWTGFTATVKNRRTLGLLALAAVLISTNWGTYIWGVVNDHVVETSLGYFINPLVSVLLGVLVLGERLRPIQWAAIGVATAGVLGLTVDYGRPPWVALILAFSFGLYGLTKKKANAGAVESLVVETAVLAPVALSYVVYLVATGESTFGTEGLPHALLLVGTGVITVIPLLCFGGAATRIPLSTLGLLQYITPTTQFLIGVLVFAEPMPTSRWLGFAVIWTALAIFTVDSLRNRRRQLRVAAESAAV
jgi:chloramphenicol-sensitive protein RarD